MKVINFEGDSLLEFGAFTLISRLSEWHGWWYLQKAVLQLKSNTINLCWKLFFIFFLVEKAKLFQVANFTVIPMSHLFAGSKETIFCQNNFLLVGINTYIFEKKLCISVGTESDKMFWVWFRKLEYASDLPRLLLTWIYKSTYPLLLSQIDFWSRRAFFFYNRQWNEIDGCGLMGESGWL